MKKYIVANMSRDLYDLLKQRVKQNKSNIRIESQILHNDYVKLKTMENKLRGKKLFMFK